MVLCIHQQFLGLLLRNINNANSQLPQLSYKKLSYCDHPQNYKIIPCIIWCPSGGLFGSISCWPLKNLMSGSGKPITKAEITTTSRCDSHSTFTPVMTGTPEQRTSCASPYSKVEHLLLSDQCLLFGGHLISQNILFLSHDSFITC